MNSKAGVGAKAMPQNSGPPGDKAFPSIKRPLTVWFGAGMSAASARFIHAQSRSSGPLASWVSGSSAARRVPRSLGCSCIHAARACTWSRPSGASTALIMGQVNVIEDLLFSQAAGNGFIARCLPSMDRERPKPPADTSTSFQAALDTIADMRELVIRRRADQDANVELLRGVQRRPVIHPEHDARDLLAAASAKFDALADATDNLHERGFWARAQEQMARYAATLAYVRTLEEGIPQSWEHVHYTRPEVDQAEAVITWHGELIRSYAVQAASEKVTRLANETITMLREKREKVVKEDGSIAARNIIARLGKGELRTDAALREQVLDVLVVHRHLIPTARRGHYMMMVPHD